MTPQDYERMWLLFEEAKQKGSAERWAYLEEHCADNSELCREVVRLLAQTEAVTTNFLARPILRDVAFAPPAPADDPLLGKRVGPYEIRQRIGDGGMGIVYMAEQESPVRRRVALKIIKPGMDTEQVIARFEAERQALAIMDHPHIAKVFDAGATENGRPYFVMELVGGVPITAFSDEHRLTPRERLELFIPVCQAIQHAHQKGIIHRDIKPTNVLVITTDGKPTPKVIDFGIAKAIDQRLTEKTLFTRFGVVVGTLEYMSPEQAELGALDVDTRSDVYSLGVLLYELLAGTTPLERSKLCESAYSEILRRIREEEPPRPSTRLSDSRESLPSISARRQTEPARLARLLRGELDWIVMKALEKDRARRYETASGLARDIERYLAGDAVEAGPPSALYRLRKQARKHRAALLTLAGFVALLVTTAAGGTYLAVRATRAEAATAQERDRARDAEGKALANLVRAQEEGRRAKQSDAEAQAVLTFFRDKVVAAARPQGQPGGLGRDVSLLAALDAAEQGIAGGFVDQPTVEAAIRHTLGESYSYLGEPNRAIRQYERARALRATVLGADHLDTLETMIDLAVAYQNARRNADAIRLEEQALGICKRTLGPDHPHTTAVMVNLAGAYDNVGRVADALPLLEETLNRQRARLGPDHRDTITTMNNIAATYRQVGRPADAIAQLEETRTVAVKSLGRDHPLTLAATANLGRMYLDSDRQAEALPLLKESLEVRRAKLGAEHPETAVSMTNLARAYLAGQPHRAEPLLRESLAIREKKFLDDWATFDTRSLLGASLLGQKRFAEAEPLLISGYEGLKAREATMPRLSRRYVAEAGARVVQLYDAWGRKDKADEWRTRLSVPGKP